MDEGSIGSMKELGVTESYKLKRQVVISASEAAEMIIRYDFLFVFTRVITILICAAIPAEWTTFYARRHESGRQHQKE